MSDNALVTPLAFSLPRAVDSRTQDKFQVGPQSVPVTVTAIKGELVTVKIEVQSKFTIPQITIPQAFSQWVRPPTQVGDKGFAVTADYYLGGQSGQGGGTANLYGSGNLTNLVFVPISQKGFSSRNLNAVLIEGPQGVVIQDSAGHCVITVTATTFSLVDSYGNTILTQANKICVIPATSGKVFLGGDGVTGGYSQVLTGAGASLNVWARIS